MTTKRRTPETDHVQGYRHEIPDGCNHGPISTNSRSLESVIHPNTLPMRSVVVPTCPLKADSTMKPRRNGMFIGQRAPESFKVERRRASASEMHEAAKHSPQVESYYNNSTLKHTAFTSRRRRGDEDQE